MSFFHGKVELKDTKNCFISIPSNWNLKNFAPNEYNLIVVKIIFLDEIKCDKYIFVTWNGIRNYNDDFVVFDRSFASKLNILEGESILVQALNSSTVLDVCTSCDIRPLSEDDYQLVTLNAAEIENQLLNQIRVFTTTYFYEKESSKFNIFPVWLQNISSTPIYVELCNFEPKNKKGLILVQSSKLVIHSPLSEIEFSEINDAKKMKVDSSPFSPFKFVTGVFRSIIPEPQVPPINPTEIDSSKSELKNQGFKSIPLYRGKSFLLRVLPYKSELNLNFNYGTALVSKVHFELFKQKFNLSENYCLLKFRKLLSTVDKNEEQKKNKNDKPYSVEADSLSGEDKFNTLLAEKFIKFSENPEESVLLVFASELCPPNSIILNECIRNQFLIPVTSYVEVCQIEENEMSLNVTYFKKLPFLLIPVLSKVTLFPVGFVKNKGQNDSKYINEFKELVCKSNNSTFKNCIFANNGLILKFLKTKFFLYYSDVETFDLEKCDMSKIVKNCFFIETDTQIIIKNVSIQYDILKMFPLLTKDLDTLDRTHLPYLYNDSVLSFPFGGTNPILEKCLYLTELGLKLSSDNFGKHSNDLFGNNLSISNLYNTLLLVGPKGSGKSTLVERLLYEMTQKHYVFCQAVNCSFITGKRIESLQKSWTSLFEEAFQRQPSIVFLDQLDEIAYDVDDRNSNYESIDNVSVDSVYCERVSYVLLQLIDSLRRFKYSQPDFSRVVVIAAAESLTVLNKVIKNSNLFDEIVELSYPNFKQRSEIIKEIAQKKDLSSPTIKLNSTIQFDLNRISRATKSFYPHDLNVLMDIALHNALVRVLNFKEHDTDSLPDTIYIEDKDIDFALGEYVPKHLQKVDLRLNSKRCLADIGGLHSVKEVVLNTILLPSRYPKIFSNLPLKPPNSMLLYGMPGTGKTMLVEAIAKESGLNFIGIKGPELLSKYIGASEKSVRELFARAQAAAPCILFFDEFDSLAPRRGHDSTGVTDRIVNQMLTLLDGLEEMKRNVYIMGATSRPDLIDLALLRPGRFDQCLLCDIPNTKERLEILSSLSRKIKVDTEQVNFEQIAEATSNFTGADLQALLYNAYLNATKNIDVANITEGSSNPVVVIRLEDMDKALHTTKPSLNDNERDRFNRIYTKFADELSGKAVPFDRTKAVTLA